MGGVTGGWEPGSEAVGFAHAAASGTVSRAVMFGDRRVLAPIYSEVLSDAKGISENGMWSPSGWRSVCVTSCSERSACEAYLEKETFFLAETRAHVVLWLPRRGPAGGSEAAPGLGAAGGGPPPAVGGVP